MLRFFAIALTVIAVGWSAAWFAGRAVVLDQIEERAEALRMAGGAAEYEALSLGGFPFAYKGDVRSVEFSMPVADRSSPSTGVRLVDYQWRAPWLRAEVLANAPTTLQLAFPPEQEVAILPRGGQGGEALPALPSDIRIASENMTLRSTLDGAMQESDLAADSLQVSSRLGVPERPAVSLDLGAAALAVSVRSPVRASAPPEEAEGAVSMADLRVLGRVRPVGAPYARSFAVESASVKASGKASDGRAAIDMDFDNLAFVLDGPDDISFLAAMAQIAADVPVEAVAGSDRFDLGGTLRDVMLSPGLWQRFDPEGVLDQNLPMLTFALDGTMRHGFSLQRALGGEALLGLESLRLKDFRVEALGLEIDAEGALKAPGGVLDGSLALEVGGISRFLESIVRAGLVPPQQAIMARLMVQNLGRPGRTPDHTRFEIVLRDGVSHVNGTAVGPAPSLPR